jgi:hypothetical protein
MAVLPVPDTRLVLKEMLITISQKEEIKDNLENSQRPAPILNFMNKLIT